jgi:hypothetical protein
MDATRQAADSHFKYKLYFDLLHSKMEEHSVQPHNTCNMDKKGFMIGVIRCSKRTFTWARWKKREVTMVLQDDSQEWIIVVAAVCADGTALPPGLIYESANRTLQLSWVADIKAGIHNVFTASTPSG